MSTWIRRCVLVPTDFSDPADNALDEARMIVDDPSHLHVLHVVPPLHPADPSGGWGDLDDEARIQHVEKHLRERLDEAGLQGAHVHAAIGDPGQLVAQTGKRIGADLIVVASKGRTGIERLLLGSVAERVARLAHCPVLIVRRES